MGYIYKITNNVNKKVYIGQTHNSVQERWREHRYVANATKVNYPLYKAMRKYGVENFSIETIEEIANEQLSDRERFWINFYNSYIGSGLGYNATLGGEGIALINIDKVYLLWDEGKAISEIAEILNHDRSSIRKVLQGYKNYSIEESNLRGDAIQGINRQIKVYQFDEQANLIAMYSSCKEVEQKTGLKAKAIWAAIKAKGFSGGFQWCYEEDIKNIAPKKNNYKNHRVIQKTKEGIILNIYKNAAEAGRNTGISPICIRNVCQGKNKTSGGFIWEYER